MWDVNNKKCEGGETQELYFSLNFFCQPKTVTPDQKKKKKFY